MRCSGQSSGDEGGRPPGGLREAGPILGALPTRKGFGLCGCERWEGGCEVQGRAGLYRPGHTRLSVQLLPEVEPGAGFSCAESWSWVREETDQDKKIQGSFNGPPHSRP